MNEAKRDRRKLRRQLAAAAMPNFMRRMGMHSTTGSIRAAVKMFVDRQISQMVAAQRNVKVRPIEDGELVCDPIKAWTDYGPPLCQD